MPIPFNFRITVKNGFLCLHAQLGGALRVGRHAHARFASTVLPAEADAVIIGGGSIGTSTLYHLAKEHGLNALLLESEQLTSGTTWHSAGLLWQLAGLMGQLDTDLASAQYTKRLVTDVLPEETGGDWAGWT